MYLAGFTDTNSSVATDSNLVVSVNDESTVLADATIIPVD
jgi:hypothetical protein